MLSGFPGIDYVERLSYFCILKHQVEKLESHLINQSYGYAFLGFKF